MVIYIKNNEILNHIKINIRTYAHAMIYMIETTKLRLNNNFYEFSIQLEMQI